MDVRCLLTGSVLMVKEPVNGVMQSVAFGGRVRLALCVGSSQHCKRICLSKARGAGHLWSRCVFPVCCQSLPDV